MFCTISFIENKKRFAKNYKIELEKVGDIEFLKVIVYKRSIIKKVEKKLKSKISFVIPSANLNNYNFENIQVYDSNNFLNEISKNTFLHILDLCEFKINNMSICIVDKECKHQDFVYKLINKTAILKVTTNSIDEYSKISECMLDDFGVSLIINDKIQNANLGIIFEDTIKIWIGNKDNIYLINKNCFSIGASLRKYIPTAINEFDFASMLYNYNEFKRLKFLYSNKLFKDGSCFEINRYNIKKILDIKHTN